MRLLLYAEQSNKMSHKFFMSIEPFIKSSSKILYQSITTLIEGLRKPFQVGQDDIAILVFSDEKDLDALLTVQNCLRSFRTLVVLPSRDKKVVSKAHKLRPRFLSFIDDNLDDFQLVLSKMINNSHKENFELG